MDAARRVLRPDCLSLDTAAVTARIERSQARRLEAEALLWWSLLAALVGCLDIPQRLLRSARVDKLSILIFCWLATLWLLAMAWDVVADGFAGRRAKRAFSFRMSVGLTLVLPLFWIAVTYRELGALSLLLAFVGIFSVLMLDHLPLPGLRRRRRRAQCPAVDE